MGRIILTRPGIQVVCGKVLAVRAGELDLELTSDKQNLVLTLCVESQHLKRLAPVYGSFVVATIHPTEATIALADGAVCPWGNVRVEAYNVRYSGSFDFKALSDAEEEHVFCGSISRSALLPDGKTLIQVTWKKNGVQENRLLFVNSDIRSRLKSRAVFVTGHKQTNKKGNSAYRIKGMCSC